MQIEFGFFIFPSAFSPLPLSFLLWRGFEFHLIELLRLITCLCFVSSPASTSSRHLPSHFLFLSSSPHCLTTASLSTYLMSSHHLSSLYFKLFTPPDSSILNSSSKPLPPHLTNVRVLRVFLTGIVYYYLHKQYTGFRCVFCIP